MNNDTNPSNNDRSTYVYFIAFQYMDGRGLGFANMEASLSTPMRSLTDVQEVEAYLRDEGYARALVMGFNLLRKNLVADQVRGQA
jgi:hypothetical protein